MLFEMTIIKNPVSAFNWEKNMKNAQVNARETILVLHEHLREQFFMSIKFQQSSCRKNAEKYTSMKYKKIQNHLPFSRQFILRAHFTPKGNG